MPGSSADSSLLPVEVQTRQTSKSGRIYCLVFLLGWQYKMSKIDGIIILDTNGYVHLVIISILWVSVVSNYDMELRSKPIICSNFASHLPSYATTHIDTFNAARKRALVGGPGRGIDPVLWVNTIDSGRTGMLGGGLCHSERNGLYFLVPIGQEGEAWNYLNDRYADERHQSRQWIRSSHSHS